jgi:hypothetical protein
MLEGTTNAELVLEIKLFPLTKGCETATVQEAAEPTVIVPGLQLIDDSVGRGQRYRVTLFEDVPRVADTVARRSVETAPREAAVVAEALPAGTVSTAGIDNSKEVEAMEIAVGIVTT